MSWQFVSQHKKIPFVSDFETPLKNCIETRRKLFNKRRKFSVEPFFSVCVYDSLQRHRICGLTFHLFLHCAYCP